MGIEKERQAVAEFVGRQRELATFERAIADAHDGLPSVVLLSGDAGIGKTTLVEKSAARAGVERYLGRTSHLGSESIPLAPLADLMRQIRRRRSGAMEGMARMQELLTPNAIAPGSDRPVDGGLFPTVLELLTRLGDDASAGSVVVGIEDLHWADAATWDLFEYLARNMIDEHLVLVGTYRANEVAGHPAQRARVAELARLTSVRRIHLEGLDRDEVSARVGALLGERASSALVDQVMARGQGNPFFTDELVAAHLAGEQIPAVLSDLISIEIADLDDPERRVLAAAATIGREPGHELLAAVVGLDESVLEDALRTLVDQRLLFVDGDAYTFRHPLLAEVTYADLLPPQRARLHLRVAAVLQQQPPEALLRADRSGELAFHLDRGGDHDHAFAALLAAADAAETVVPGAAFSHLERALELWDSVSTRPAGTDLGALLWRAADIATSTVGNERAVTLARQAFEHGTPPQGAAWGHERLGRYLWASGHLDDSRAEFDRAIELLESGGESRAAPIYAGLAQAELMAGRNDRAGHWCTTAFDLVPTPQHDPLAWSMSKRVLGIACSNQGDTSRAVELCHASVTAAPTAQARALATLYLCVALSDAGNHPVALRTAQDAVAEGQLTGLDSGFGCYFDALAAEALLRLGRWNEIPAVLSRQPLPATLPVGLLRLARVQALLAARRGETGEAVEHLAAAAALPIDGWHRTLRDATTAEVQLVLGNWDEATEAAEQGWATETGSTALWAARFAMFAVVADLERTLDRQACGEQVETETARIRLDELLQAAYRTAERVPGGPQPDTAAHLAHATATLNRRSTQRPDDWSTAVARWSDLGDPWAVAAALVREADAAAATGAMDRAVASLHRAHSIANELDARPLLDEITALAKRTRISLDTPDPVTLVQTTVERLGLTPREAEVLALVAAGRTNRQIGDELFVSTKTASVHVSNILRKLDVSSRVDAAAIAQRSGIT